MKNCIKGKLSVERIGSKLFIIDDKGFSVTKVRYCKKAEANAEELIRRWNAFEDGGLVEELRTACKAQEKADNWFGSSSTGRKLKDEAKSLREAALAKS